MKSKNFNFRKIAALFLTLITVFSLSFFAFADESGADMLFGYHTETKNTAGDETVWGYILWVCLLLLIAALVFLAVMNFIRIKREEKASGKKVKPMLVIKKRFKN